VTELVATRDRLARLTEELHAIETRAGVTRDEIVSRRAEELNDRVYALTILAGVFLPLSVITGLLGMNVGGVPLMDSPYGFWITTISLVVLLVISLTLLRLKRWI
jgi:zinc transporter